MSEEAVVQEVPTRSYTLEKYQLLRYEVISAVSLELSDGTAEVFGTELILKRKVALQPGNLGTVLTMSGAVLAVYGSGLVAFVTSSSEDQSIPHIYLNIHANLERMRDAAEAEQRRGPRILVCGQESVGKSTLCRILASYAARKRRKPILVDVNVGLSQVCIPGTLAALAVTKPFDLQEGWSLEEDPLVFSFGHLYPAENLNLFREQVNNLAELVNIRSENDASVFASGCIINMNGFRKDDSDAGESRQKGIEAIRTTAAAFEVDHILVIEDGFLENFLREDLPSEVVIVRLPKSSGAHTRSTEQWTRQRDARVCAYFHGGGRRRLQPHHITLPTDAFTIYKIGAAAIPDALLPHGETSDEDTWRKPIPRRVTNDLTNRILAISQAEDADTLPECPVYGFVVVLSVADDKSSITLLAPSSSPPPAAFFLLTDMRYIDPEKIG